MKIIYKIHPKTILVLKSKVMKLKTERDLPVHVHMCFWDLYASLMIFTPSPGNLVAWEEQDRWMARGMGKQFWYVSMRARPLCAGSVWNVSQWRGRITSDERDTSRHGCH